MTMQIVCLIPACGKGLRFGKPKAEAEIKGNLFSDIIIETLRKTDISEWLLLKEFETIDMLATLRKGREYTLAQGKKPDGWLIWPVDHPFVKAETINLLTAMFTIFPNSVIVPIYNECSGHPIIIPVALDFSSGNYPEGLRQLIRASHFSVRKVITDDPNILNNINFTEDLLYV